jgi:hypothetical protein
MQIEHVFSPDELRDPQIRPFLGHKPPNYLHHLDSAMAGECDDLQTHFYIGVIDEEVVGNIMTIEANGVGIFGHVNTRADQRRKGICSQIMERQMEDFRAREGRVLLLGTGYQSAAYNIYASFGFKDWKVGRPGMMRYDNPEDPNFEEHFFAHSPTQPVPARWKHWPLVSLIAHIHQPDVYLRSLLFEIFGVQLLEGAYCKYMQEHNPNPEASAFVLESSTGAVVACVTRVPDRRWLGQVNLLDLFYHENFTRYDLIPLLEALPPTSKPTQCWVDPRDHEKNAALERVGFRRSAVVSRQFHQEEGHWRDAWLYAKG